MCSIEKQGQTMVLKLVGNEEHWLGPKLLMQIEEALEEVQNSDAAAFIMTNDGKFFSNGLDVEYMEHNPKLAMQIVYQFEKVLLKIMQLKMPTIAAICGHAVAGAFVLTLAHDYRFMASDRGFILNRSHKSPLAKSSISIPPATFTLPRTKLTPQAFRDVFLTQSRNTATVAHELGIIDRHFPDRATTLAAALDHASLLSQRGLNPDGYRRLRLLMYPQIIHELEESEKALQNLFENPISDTKDHVEEN